jgi:hypothetical protein
MMRILPTDITGKTTPSVYYFGEFNVWADSHNIGKDEGEWELYWEAWADGFAWGHES